MGLFVRNHVITVTGYVLATDFTRRGKVSEIVLETEDFHQYSITPDEKGKELFDLLFAKVTVKGVIEGEDMKGNPLIKISHYKIDG